MLEKISVIRRNRGLSQKELAERCEVTQQFIQQIEKGAKNPSVKVLRKLAMALDVSVDELLKKAS